MNEEDLLAALPLRVEGVAVQDPILNLFGTGWFLTIACPWRGAVGGRAISWEDDNLYAVSQELVGEHLIEILRHGSSVEFRFTTSTLTATADTDLDPWVLQLPGGGYRREKGLLNAGPGSRVRHCGCGVVLTYLGAMAAWVAAHQADDDVRLTHREGRAVGRISSAVVGFETESALGSLAVWETGEVEAEVVVIKTLERPLVISTSLQTPAELVALLDRVTAVIIDPESGPVGV